MLVKRKIQSTMMIKFNKKQTLKVVKTTAKTLYRLKA